MCHLPEEREVGLPIGPEMVDSVRGVSGSPEERARGPDTEAVLGQLAPGAHHRPWYRRIGLGMIAGEALHPWKPPGITATERYTSTDMSSSENTTSPS